MKYNSTSICNKNSIHSNKSSEVIDKMVKVIKIYIKTVIRNEITITSTTTTNNNMIC